MLNFAGQFVFVSSSGRLLQSHTDGEMHASQTVDNAGDEERWNVYVWEGGKISLQNYRTNHWLCAEKDTFKAICDRTAPSTWEQWTLTSAGDGAHVHLRSWQERWLCAQPPDDDTQFGGEVIADRPNAAQWETFAMIPSSGMQVHNQSWWNDVSNAIQKAANLAPILVDAAG